MWEIIRLTRYRDLNIELDSITKLPVPTNDCISLTHPMKTISKEEINRCIQDAKGKDSQRTSTVTGYRSDDPAQDKFPDVRARHQVSDHHALQPLVLGSAVLGTQILRPCPK